MFIKIRKKFYLAVAKFCLKMSDGHIEKYCNNYQLKQAEFYTLCAKDCLEKAGVVFDE